MDTIEIKQIPQIKEKLTQVLIEIQNRPMKTQVQNKRVEGQIIKETYVSPESEHKSVDFDLVMGNEKLNVRVYKSGIVKYNISLTYEEKYVNIGTKDKEIRNLLRQIEIEFLKKCE